MSKSGHSWRSNYVIYNFKMAAAVAQCHFRFCMYWCHFHLKVKIFPQTKFRRRTRILIHGWDITTSGLKKNKRQPFWNSSTFCDFDQIAVIFVLFWIKFPNFVQIGHPRRNKWYKFKMAAAAARYYLRFRI